MEPRSDYETYTEYVDVADPLLQMPQLYHREIREITLYAESIEVPHGNTLMPLSRAKEQEWYSQLESGTLMQWTVTRGADQEITASRKFYDGDDITAVLSMSLDYRAVLEPFTNLLLDNTGGIVLDGDGNMVYAGYSLDEGYRPAQSESLEYIPGDGGDRVDILYVPSDRDHHPFGDGPAGREYPSCRDLYRASGPPWLPVFPPDRLLSGAPDGKYEPDPSGISKGHGEQQLK